MNKYEKLIEYIISEQDDLARELFHEIVVEKSRSIYENLMDETDMGGSPVEDLVNEISADESEMYEADDDMGDDMGDDMPVDMGDEEGMDDDMPVDMGDEEGSEEGSEEGGEDDDEADDESEADDDAELEDRVDDLESALDELKAEFDKIMAGEDQGMSGEEDEENLIREYVEKVGLPSNKAEGHEVGKGGSVAVNKSSIVAGKNDMGGTTANIAKGGAEANPDGTSAKKPANYGTKGQGQLKGAGSYENVPGANTKGYKNRASAKQGEEGGVNKNSIEPGN